MCFTEWLVAKYEYGLFTPLRKGSLSFGNLLGKKRLWRKPPLKSIGALSSCPSCKGALFFQREDSFRGDDGSTFTISTPQCYSCGFPLVQSGSTASLLATVELQGETLPAPQPAGAGVSSSNATVKD